MCLGVPGKIIDIYHKNGLRMGMIDFTGVQRESCLEYVPDAEVGNYVLVHVGFALNVISDMEAKETLDLLYQITSSDQETDSNQIK